MGKRVDYTARASQLVQRDRSAADKAPSRFDRATSMLEAMRSRLQLDEILPREAATREIQPEHVSSLAESIGALGLIEPVVVDTSNRLLAGGHRCEAIRLLRTEQPDLYARWFNDGVPVRVMEFDADSDPGRALEIEIAENEHRRDYSINELRDLVQRLRTAGYRETVGRPRVGEKAIGPQLELVVGKSMKTIRKLLREAEGQVDGNVKPPSEHTLEAVLRALSRHRERIPSRLLAAFDEVLVGLREEIHGHEIDREESAAQ
jgi:ParB family transcriptional regulator, chromosome partitioning protein